MSSEKHKGQNNRSNGGEKSSSRNVNIEQSEKNQTPIIPPYMGPQPGFYPAFGLPTLQNQPPAQMFRPGFPSYPTQDSSSMYELFHEINSRLKSIETNVAKIGPMEQDLAYLKSQMFDIRETNSTLTQKVLDIEKSCQYNSDLADDVLHLRNVEITEIKSRNSQLESQVNTLLSQNVELNTRCLDIQSKLMESDLIIFGVEEARTGEGQREDVESTLRASLTTSLIENDDITNETPITNENLNFEKVYRVGDPVKARNFNRPRPIIAKFVKISDRNIVRKAGIAFNTMKKSVKIYEHFPREVEERRKKLYPIVRHLSDQGERVSLVRDRLYINNKPYNVSSGAYTDKLGRTSYVRPNPPAYYGENRERNQRPQYRPNPTVQPERRMFVDKQVEKSSGRTLNFETPNRYSALAMDVDRSSQKRKERSPLEADITLKRQNTDAIQYVENDGVLVDLQSTIPRDALQNAWADSRPTYIPNPISDPQGAPHVAINADDTNT